MVKGSNTQITTISVAGIFSSCISFFIGRRNVKLAPYMLACLEIWNIWIMFGFFDILKSPKETLPLGVCKGFLMFLSLNVSGNLILKYIILTVVSLGFYCSFAMEGASFSAVSALGSLLTTIAMGFYLFLEEKNKRINFKEHYVELLNLRRWKLISEKFMPAGIVVVNGIFSANFIENGLLSSDSLKPLEILYFNKFFNKFLNISDSSELIQFFKKLPVNNYRQSHKENDLFGSSPMEIKAAENFHGLLLRKCMRFNGKKISSETNNDELKIGEFSSKLVQHDNNVEIGEDKNFEISLFDFRWEEKPCILVIVHDVSEQKKNEKLIVLDKYKDLLMASVSHELKTPLNSIIGITSLLLSKKLDEDVRALLSQIQTSGDFLLNEINDILDYSLISNGRLRLNAQSFSLDELVKQICQLFQIPLKEKNLELITELSSVHDLRVNTDFMRLKQVFINLVANAIKFTFQGSVTIKIEELLARGEIIQISIKDTGCGMRRETINNLFQVFGTYDETLTNANIHGVGLGLTISKQIVGKLGPEEKIYVESEPGVGSEFQFRIFRDLSKYCWRNEIKMRCKISPLRYLPKPIEAHVGPTINLAVRGRHSPKTSPVSCLKYSAYPKFTNSKHKRADKIKSCSSAINFFKRMSPKRLSINPPTKKSPESCSQIKARKPSLTLETNPPYTSEDYGDEVNILEENLIEAAKNPYQSKPAKISQALFDFTRASASHDLGLRRNEALRVLIVDDTPFNIIILENFLKGIENLKIYIERAFNGAECLEIVEKQSRLGIKFDIIFMDCNMPVIDGFEASLRLREKIKLKQFPDSFILGISAYSGEKIKERCLACGMNDFITKPITQENFRKFLFKWIS